MGLLWGGGGSSRRAGWRRRRRRRVGLLRGSRRRGRSSLGRWSRRSRGSMRLEGCMLLWRAGLGRVVGVMDTFWRVRSWRSTRGPSGSRRRIVVVVRGCDEHDEWEKIRIRAVEKDCRRWSTEASTRSAHYECISLQPLPNLPHHFLCPAAICLHHLAGLIRALLHGWCDPRQGDHLEPPSLCRLSSRTSPQTTSRGSSSLLSLPHPPHPPPPKCLPQIHPPTPNHCPRPRTQPPRPHP